MKHLLLTFFCFTLFTGIGQNGFTTYTTNVAFTGALTRQSSLLIDSAGNKWIGFSLNLSGNFGLVKYDNTSWTVYNTASTPALPSNVIYALAQDNSGNIWIGTNAGLVKFNGINFTTYTTVNGLPSNTITCIETVGAMVYAGTYYGLSRYDGVNFTNYNVSGNTLPADTISAIKAESASVIWLGGKKRLVELTVNASFTSSSYINHPLTSSAGIVNCVYIDAQNKKWIGTTGAGAFVFDGSSFVNAKDLYDVYGGAIPSNVYDIAEGLNNGVAMRMVTSAFSNVCNGIVELAPDKKIYQYFQPSTILNMGDYISRDGSGLIISQGGPSVFYAHPRMYYAFDKSSYAIPFTKVNSTNLKSLDINQVKAGIANLGDMHWDMNEGLSLYEVPKGSGKKSNFASAIWIGGFDGGGQLHVASQTYRQNGTGFWPGPLDTLSAMTDTSAASNYDKLWKVSYTDINDFIMNFNNGNVQNNTFKPIDDILTWPAHGTGAYSRNLAPFVDINQNGVYDPLTGGDYPDIKGDQALYSIFNDNLSGGAGCSPMKIEVHAMAYAYGCDHILAGYPELNYTTFYNYKIINRSSTAYQQVRAGMWSDVDLGYYGDDFIGTDVRGFYGYAYNGDAFDESVTGIKGYGAYPPAQGFAVLKGPLSTLNGIDDDYDGMVDEPNEEDRLHQLTYFSNHFPGTPIATTEPSNCSEFYNYLNGYWKDGTPFTCGGNAYGGTGATNWVYPGDPNNIGVSTDPANTCGYWTESSAGNTPNDRRMILSSGFFNLNPGQMVELEYAFITSFDSSGTSPQLQSVAKLKTDVQKVNLFYNQVTKPNCLELITGVRNNQKSVDFMLYPNPAQSSVTLKLASTEGIKTEYEVVDVLGKVILKQSSLGNTLVIDVSALKPGIYFLRLTANDQSAVKKFVKE